MRKLSRKEKGTENHTWKSWAAVQPRIWAKIDEVAFDILRPRRGGAILFLSHILWLASEIRALLPPSSPQLSVLSKLSAIVQLT